MRLSRRGAAGAAGPQGIPGVQGGVGPAGGGIWSGFAVPPWNGVAAAVDYACGLLFGNMANQLQTIDQLVATPFMLSRPGTVNSLALNNQGSGGVGSKHRIGLYNSDPSHFGPTSLLVDGGEIDATILGGVRVAVNVPLLAGKVYWAAYICGVGAPTMSTIPAQAMWANNNVIGPQGPGSNVVFSIVKVARAYGALPDPFPLAGLTAIQQNMVAVYLRFSA